MMMMMMGTHCSLRVTIHDIMRMTSQGLMGALSGVGYRRYWVIDDSNRAEADMLIRRITSQKTSEATGEEAIHQSMAEWAQ